MGNCLSAKQTKDIVDAAEILTDVAVDIAEANGADVPDNIEEALDKTFDVAGDVLDVAVEHERKTSVKAQPSQQ